MSTSTKIINLPSCSSERNGNVSNSKRMKYIKMKYLFVRDKINLGKVMVKHKPTEKRWIGIYTELKKENPFHVDHSFMMNCPISITPTVMRSVLHLQTWSCHDYMSVLDSGWAHIPNRDNKPMARNHRT